MSIIPKTDFDRRTGEHKGNKKISERGAYIWAIYSKWMMTEKQHKIIMIDQNNIKWIGKTIKIRNETNQER